MLIYVFAALFILSIIQLKKSYDADDGNNIKKWKTINTVCIVGEWFCIVVAVVAAIVLYAYLY